MAAEGGKKVLVETDFIFGLNPRDILHPYVERIISLHTQGLLKCYLVGTALIEFRTVLYSHGLKSHSVHEAIAIVIDKLNEYKIEVISVKPNHILSADFLRTKYPQLSFFDALHAGVAYEEKVLLVSYDKTYSQIKEISWKRITQF